jgi:restriction system protein
MFVNMASNRNFNKGVMMTRRSLITSLAKMQRAIERDARAAERERQKAIKERERLTKITQRNQALSEKERAKFEAQQYLEGRTLETEQKNLEIEEKLEALENILNDTLGVDDYLDLERLKKKPAYPDFYVPKDIQKPNPNKPVWETYLPAQPSGFKKLIPGTNRKYEEEVAKAKQFFENTLNKYNEKESARQEQISELKAHHEKRIKEIDVETQKQHQEIDTFKRDLEAANPEAIMNYCTLVLESSEYPEGFPQHAKIAYVPESKQLVIEYDLPTLDDIIPDIKEYKYVKAGDKINSTAMPPAQRKTLYRSVIAQVAIRTLHEIFEADRLKHVETIVFNGYVESVDKGTGRDVRTCLITVRTTRDVFTSFDLSRIEPEACLKNMNASVSQKPEELAPVRPVLEFNMVDPRFVEETDVISTLDQRPNLMELKPTEFESLITNLFQKMGLESRLTQASRDGGVDCVAFDPRPIFGGKVVIQAKRYKNTVGVSAVRDLYGTLQNEGASKGILVSTSGYGKAAFEFADGKPIELIAGSQLLYLLEEHAGVKAKIVVPEAWVDPIADA